MEHCDQPLPGGRNSAHFNDFDVYCGHDHKHSGDDEPDDATRNHATRNHATGDDPTRDHATGDDATRNHHYSGDDHLHSGNHHHHSSNDDHHDTAPNHDKAKVPIPLLRKRQRGSFRLVLGPLRK